ncbi:protein-export chaperone SecB [Salinarimonas sp. NSM]|uniref:protein-export chaperone SecB n=1 Tax=Salinarimonas sp. NSM TaxID=3458003 RepID=UPI0040350770
MADTPATNGAQNGGAPNGGGANAAPSLNALAQYTKDFSFENPSAPRSLAPQQAQPKIGIQVNVNAKQMSETDYEVDLKLEGDAKTDDVVMFKFELNYAGVFRVKNVPKEQLHPVVMIECPRLLFPFARQIVADAVRNGGFPPLYIDPIDFVALYRQRVAAAQQAQAAAPGGASGGEGPQTA